MSAARPLLHRKRKSIGGLALSQELQQSKKRLFDHFIGKREQIVGYRDTERLGRLHVDEKWGVAVQKKATQTILQL
jgi:hypothetical protein